VTGRRRRSVGSYWMALSKTRRYWKLDEEALDRTLCMTRRGGSHGPLARQTKNERKIEWMTYNYTFHEICALLGSYAAKSSNFLPTFGTTCRSHPESQRIADDGSERLPRIVVTKLPLLRA